jgi:small subunit ribosomal protein S1
MNEDLAKNEQLTNNTKEKEAIEVDSNEAITVEEQEAEESTNDELSSEEEESSEEKTEAETEEVKTDEEETKSETQELESSEEQDIEALAEEVKPEEMEASDEEETETDEEPFFIDADVEMEQALEAFEDAFEGPSVGSIVKGEIVKVTPDEVMVDIGYKSEGYIDISEFEKRPDGNPDVNVGDKIDVYFMRKEDENGIIVLSKEIANNKLAWKNIEDAYKEGTQIKGKVVKRIKGGLRIEIGNLFAFLPASQVDLHPVSNLDDYVGKELEMKVIKLSRRSRNIVLSRRLLLEEELEEKKNQLLDSLEADQLREGVVKNITEFGAFVDLGGVDGLLHKTDMSWGRVNHPSEKVSKGDELEVKILDIDKERESVAWIKTENA